MWRKLTVLLFLLILANSASALEIAELFNDSHLTYEVATQVDPIEQVNTALEHDNSDVLYNLPRTSGVNASLFTAEVQITPKYFLLVEFFKIKLTAGLFKNLTNPPLVTPWFEQLSHSSNSSRLSGWKDGNFLYSSRTTYHS